MNDFIAYVAKVTRRAVKNTLTWGRDQLIGIVLVALTFLFQMRAGLITGPESAAEAWALAFPYIVLFGVFLLAEFVRSAWQLDAELRSQLAALSARLGPPLPMKERKSRIANSMDYAVYLLKHNFDRDRESDEIWQRMVDRWTTTTYEYLTSFSPDAAAVFNDTSNIHPVQYSHVPPEYHSRYVIVHRQIANLRAILDKPEVYLS